MLHYVGKAVMYHLFMLLYIFMLNLIVNENVFELSSEEINQSICSKRIETGT